MRTLTLLTVSVYSVLDFHHTFIPAVLSPPVPPPPPPNPRVLMRSVQLAAASSFGLINTLKSRTKNWLSFPGGPFT